jgi:hypothetical protein
MLGTPGHSAAFLLWDVLDNSDRANGTRGQSFVGTMIGTGSAPCWPASNKYAFYAGVTELVSAGNGSWQASEEGNLLVPGLRVQRIPQGGSDTKLTIKVAAAAIAKSAIESQGTSTAATLSGATKQLSTGGEMPSGGQVSRHPAPPSGPGLTGLFRSDFRSSYNPSPRTSIPAGREWTGVRLRGGLACLFCVGVCWQPAPSC